MLISSLSFATITTSTNDNDVILSGYDAVSYFTQDAPTQGNSGISPKALELFQPEKANKIVTANKNWKEIKDVPADEL